MREPTASAEAESQPWPRPNPNLAHRRSAAATRASDPNPNPNLPQCRCYAGFSGPKCERSSTARPLKACLNGCSGRGDCRRNWCHCRRGYFGVDCSLGQPADGGAAVPLPAPIGSQGEGAPRVYVYELPPRYNGWMHAGAGG